MCTCQVRRVCFAGGLITHQLNQEVVPGAFRAFLLGECCATGVRCSNSPGIYRVKMLSVLTNQVLVDVFVSLCCSLLPRIRIILLFQGMHGGMGRD